MPYYPKSQIQVNLYTKGKQLRVISSKKEYIGYYWKTSKGEYFSGRNPYDGSPIDLEVIPITPNSNFNTKVYEKGNEIYNTLKEVDTSQILLLPSYVKPSPTEDDYAIGNFTRFFTKKNNENLYVETSKKIFDKIKQRNKSYDYNSYLVFSLPWKLTGDKNQVLLANQNIVLITEQTQNINGLGLYLKNNYLEFYK